MNLLQKRVTIASFAATVMANARHHPDIVAKEGSFSWEAFTNLTDNGTQGFDDIAQEMNAMKAEIERLKAILPTDEAADPLALRPDETELGYEVFRKGSGYMEFGDDGDTFETVAAVKEAVGDRLMEEYDADGEEYRVRISAIRKLPDFNLKINKVVEFL